VKAGFDLNDFEGFEVEGNKVVGEWPEARILSVEQQDFEIFFSRERIHEQGSGGRLQIDFRTRGVNFLT
jgi:hypothetical protein